MKSTVIPGKSEPTITYPCLMQSKSNGQIILFTSLKQGTVVFKSLDRGYNLGVYHDGWIEATDQSTWELFTDTVTLSN